MLFFPYVLYTCVCFLSVFMLKLSMPFTDIYKPGITAVDAHDSCTWSTNAC